jgi:SAM-dependent methyltransferase
VNEPKRVAPPGFLTKLTWQLMPFIPLPHGMVLSALLRDNEAEHARHGWSRLREVSELSRYSVIRGYCEFFKPGGAILDVGCGDGILQEQLDYGRYTGIDLFESAIRKAAHKNDDRTRFLQADAANYTPKETFDVIVWNESLYYLKEPLDVATRYTRFLKPDGVIIVSMLYQAWATRRLFRRLEALGSRLAEIRITNEIGVSWMVRAYRPAPAALPTGVAT